MKKLLFLFCATTLIISACKLDKPTKEEPSAKDSIAVTKDTINKEEQNKVDSAALRDSAYAAYKDFRSRDLSCFMLHGKVKRLTESSNYGTTRTLNFNNSGKLVSATINGRKCKISQNGRNLTIDDVEDMTVYEYYLDSSDRLVKYSAYCGADGDVDNYSNFNANGWPTTLLTIAAPGTEYESSSRYKLSYSKIDKMGNWLSNGHYSRRIDYYPFSF